MLNYKVISEYSELCQHFFENKQEQLGNDWTFDSADTESTQENLLYKAFNSDFFIRARVYSNKKEQTVIVFCGNNLEKDDISNEIEDYLEFVPEAIDNLLEANVLLTTMLEDKSNYSDLVLAGFSLGAAVAEIAACRFERKAVTFESPGTRDILKELAKENTGTPSKHYSGYKNTDITTFLTVPNKINTYFNSKTQKGGHIGNIYRIYIPHVEKTSWLHFGKAVLGAFERTSVYFLFLTGIAYFFWRKTVINAALKKIVGEWAVISPLQASAHNMVQEIKNVIRLHNTGTIRKLLPGTVKTYEQYYPALIRNANGVLESENREALVEMLTQASENLKIIQSRMAQNLILFKTLTNSAKATDKTIKVWGASAFSYHFFRQVQQIPMSSKQKEVLIHKGQHSIQKISVALSKQATRRIQGGNKQEGNILPIKTWPTTLFNSWGTVIKNIGCSYLPFRNYNAGICNMTDIGSCGENRYIEANIERMDGYKLK